MTRRRRRLLISHAREEVDEFKTKVMNKVLGTNILDPNDVKMEVAKQLDIPLNQSGNGDIRAEDAGKIGGAIGGQMVKEMVRLAQESLRKSGE
ncbi:small, acid-soluble spore protein, alpha/beta type [Hazenella coriacea]|uniref:Small acid-soluble spore protein alpha/beta type n=1 Tax=Hazenella coriacea TaxID=1179467 RepID=A0A4R3L3K9_9BACL|nr:small, acid-soluble spore protein, alpha/beta type [Hazenella coriacea]TCS92344.1 small acid-soluble spore protein alpha/beta type [Hazenella coriacea]